MRDLRWSLRARAVRLGTAILQVMRGAAGTGASAQLAQLLGLFDDPGRPGAPAAPETSDTLMQEVRPRATLEP